MNFTHAQSPGLLINIIKANRERLSNWFNDEKYLYKDQDDRTE